MDGWVFIDSAACSFTLTGVRLLPRAVVYMGPFEMFAKTPKQKFA